AASTISKAEPVVLQGSSVTKWRAQQWSLDYIARKAKGPVHNIYENNNRWFGPYFDGRKPLLPYARHPNPYRTNLTLPVRTLMSRLGNTQQKTSTAASWVYFSGPLEELGAWTAEEVEPLDELLSPNPAVSSVNVWMGPPNVIAHCHYDGYHNFYAQLSGRKRFWLARPRAWPQLLTSPFLHPMHAQCQVNLSTPLTPTCAGGGSASKEGAGADADIGDDDDDVEILEVVLDPGDLLYIPPLWFHHVESIDTSISVNVWTDSMQSTTALTMFETPIPGSDLISSWDAQQRALAATMAAHSMLEVVCSTGSCSTAGDKPPLYRKLAARHFLMTVFSARYQPMLTSGLLLPPEHEWSSPLCDGGANVTELAREAIGASYAEFSEEVSTFSRSVLSTVSKLPSETVTVWLGNYVEFLGAQYVQPEHIAHWLRDASECL
ncbi:hypoxia-inducible factor 1-alpha inhibitor-like, partial [Sycon ciliatum]|uniref:hypoxia-inducible factor 1-alpha inhibitor-like n=1 Tax=Sycon ciliatum TaxID=27933 RepID=UPI0031F6D24F